MAFPRIASCRVDGVVDVGRLAHDGVVNECALVMTVNVRKSKKSTEKNGENQYFKSKQSQMSNQKWKYLEKL